MQNFGLSASEETTLKITSNGLTVAETLLPTLKPYETKTVSIKGLYTLRFDPGRQTIVTLIFIREAFGYKEPLFQPAMLDEFMLRKFDARRTK